MSSTSNNREKELKFHSTMPYEEAAAYVQSCYPKVFPIRSGGTDLFWDCLGADFIRLRPMPKAGLGELTVKRTDRASINDRLEINLDVDFKQAKQFLLAAHGPCSLSIDKRYYVYLLPEGLSISVYKVEDDVYIEVEAPTLADVRKAVPTIKDCIGEQVTQSLYQIYSERV